MLRKLFISAILLIAFLPVNSWAISTTYSFNNTGSNSWNIVHGDWDFRLGGSITGDWDSYAGVLSGITGSLTSNNGSTVISILDGFNFSGGFGLWDVSIARGNKTFTGIFNFANYGYLYAGASDIKLWGGADLDCTRANGNSCGTRWIGLDLWGPGSETVEVPEPASMGLMGLGLLGFMFARRRKDHV